MIMTEPTEGLRALKKQMTRSAISTAALDLALEKGLDHVTIEEIAHRAIVSPRTFSNYFSCKEEAVVAAGNKYWVDLLDQLADRPLDEHPLQSMRTLLVEATRADGAELQRAIRTMQLGRQSPGLRPFQSALYSQLEGSLRATVAARTGSNLQSDLFPWLVAASAVAAMKSAIMMWLINDLTVADLPDLIAEAFDQLTDGLRLPA